MILMLEGWRRKAVADHERGGRSLVLSERLMEESQVYGVQQQGSIPSRASQG